LLGPGNGRGNQRGHAGPESLSNAFESTGEACPAVFRAPRAKERFKDGTFLSSSSAHEIRDKRCV
jgi:hypothetical protein